MTLHQDDVRRIALSHPHAAEADHHGFPSFRVDGKIFATLPDAEHVHVMLDADDIEREVAANDDCCEGKMWGKKLSALRVDLAAVDEERLSGWLTDAWERRAHG